MTIKAVIRNVQLSKAVTAFVVVPATRESKALP
jgi:hypothetical protein